LGGGGFFEVVGVVGGAGVVGGDVLGVAEVGFSDFEESAAVGEESE
jgi:hypothetical protein